MDSSIIIIDDEMDFLQSLKRGLITSGMKNVLVEQDPQIAADYFKKDGHFDLALIDIQMPDLKGTDLLEIIKNISPATECIMLTAVDEARTAVECLKKGAYDYLVKPVSREDLILSINRALEHKRLLEIVELNKHKTPPRIRNREAFRPIITQSKKMLKILREAELHASSDIPILITGETGTGKELLARAVHASSRRAKFSFTPVNMESLNHQLFESQFFGHVKGAFTGAEKNMPGYLEGSHRGTIFMDEIGNLPLDLQGKLLRVLQEGEFIKIGSVRPQRVDVRIISATNAELEPLIDQNQFRRDLFYRLRGGWLHLPPLRERRDDIPLLINRFLSETGRDLDSRIDEDALSALMEYDYPGNIRELQSIVQAAENLSRGGIIQLRHLPEKIQAKAGKSSETGDGHIAPFLPLEEVERRHIINVYKRLNKNKTQASHLLGISLNTLRNKLKSYNVD